MTCAVIIVSYNTRQLLRNCLSSLQKMQKRHQYAITVIDNGSSDGSVEMVKDDFPWVKLIESGKNLGFAAGNNLALKKMKADLYILLNSDTEVEKDSLDKLVDFMANSDFGIGSCKLYFADGSFQPNFGDKPDPLPIFIWLSGLDDILPFRDKLPSLHKKYPSSYQKEAEVSWVSGSVMAIKKEVLEKTGFLDERIFMYGEDIEYCLRASKAGFKIGWIPQSQVMHIGGGSSKNPNFKQWLGEYRGLIYVYNKYYGQLAALFLKLLIYFFTFVRMVAFFAVGKPSISKTYAKIIVSL